MCVYIYIYNMCIYMLLYMCKKENSMNKNHTYRPQNKKPDDD